MKIAVTGASGKVGRMMVPLLAERGSELILFGRDASALRKIFPNHRCHSNDELSSALRGFDVLLHLAVLNNDVSAGAEEFREVNVDFLEQVLGAAREAGVRCFVNLSSTHALEQRDDPYATSKRAATERVRAAPGIAGVNLYCGKIYRSDRGQLTSHPLLWKALGAVKPAVEIERLADCLQRWVVEPRSREIICTDTQCANPFYRAGQLAIDIGFAAAVLLFFGWAMILIGIVIRFNSSGPAIFTQTRVGRHGEPFTCYKFRTMQMGTRQAGTHEVSSNSVTGVGRWLRRTKLDELPQVWNLIRRDLSLVGPRPCLPSQTELIEERRLRGVSEMRPGITGLAQINDIDMSRPAVLAEWDARYAALQSLWTDLRILILTFVGRGAGDRTQLTSLG